MFDPVVDPNAVTKAYTVPLEGATDALKFYETVAAKRRKLQSDAADAAKDEQLKTAQALQQVALKNFATGTPIDQATQQLQANSIPEIAKLSKTDPVAARFRASAVASQLESMKDYGVRQKANAVEAASSVAKNNPFVDTASLGQKLLAQTVIQHDKDGNPVLDANGQPVFNMNASGVNWGDINPNDPHSIFPYTSKQAVEKAMPAYLDQRFPKGDQTIYKDQITGQPFTDALGRQIGKDIKMSPYQVYTNGGFQTAAQPSQVEGDTIASVYTPEQLQQMTLGGGIQQPGKDIREQLGRIPTIPQDVLHTLVSDQTGQYALLHKIDDIHKNPNRYFGPNGAKVVKGMSDEQMAGYAGYDLINTHAPKGGNDVKDNLTIANERDKKAQEAITNNNAAQHLAITQADFAMKVKKDPEGQSGYAIPTGQVGSDGKPVVQHLTNKALKETNDAMESMPGMWFKALGGGGSKAQMEAISKLPPPIQFAGAKWLPLSTGTNKGDYLTDPSTQSPVQVYYDPMYKGGGRVAVVSMEPELDADGKKTGNYTPSGSTDGNIAGKAKYYTKSQFADFMHTYGPQSIKGGEIKYDRLAPLVNQAFNNNR